MLKKLPLKGFIYSALALNLLTALSVLLAKGNLPPVVPLFYGKPVGGEQLIATLGLMIAPLIVTAVTAINIFLASRINDDFIKRVLSIASFFVSALSAITVVKIILLVGFW
jgi:hypothetical protein